jgi:signal transduction histidine kinase/CheY-like chemotaxis protein
MTNPADLLAGLAAAPGDDFLRWFVGHLGRRLGCEWVVLWERCGDRWERTRTVAASRRGEPWPLDVEVDLVGTPCDLAYGSAPVVFARGLRERFPGVAMLRELGVESYVGAAYRDAAGRGLGHLTLLDARPIADPSDWITELESFRARVAGELAARLAVRELETLLPTASDASGRDALRLLARHLAHALHAKAGFVCELVPERSGRVRTLAFSVDGRDQPPMEYDLADTPCQVVQERGICLEADGVQARYPKDAFLVLMKARSFLGLRLDDGAGRPMGHVGVIHDQPLDARLAALPIVKVFVDRAAAELARRRAEADKLAIERQLFEVQKLESLGVLAGGIAHDFNNLLAGILGNASLALAGAADGEPERAHLRQIEEAARRAADLARQMLAYSGRGGADVVPLDVTELVEDTGRLLRVTIRREIALRFDLSRDLPAVRADATQLRQVVMNLVLNGAEAIGEKSGLVRVTTGRVRVDRELLRGLAPDSGLLEGEHVFLEVSDDGCGMDAATRARIFEPFFSTKAAGRGLGLAAVQGIVRGHRGALTVTSEPGRGSVFRLLLPACEEPARRPEPASPAADESRWSSTGLVLVVDDEELVRAATAKMLERLGFEVLTAIDGLAGVRVLEERGERIRLVLLDAMMPRLAGDETFAAMRRARPDVRVVVTSGYSRHEATGRMRGAGLAGFLQKPFGMKELERCVRDALSARVAEERSG